MRNLIEIDDLFVQFHNGENPIKFDIITVHQPGLRIELRVTVSNYRKNL